MFKTKEIKTNKNKIGISLIVLVITIIVIIILVAAIIITLMDNNVIKGSKEASFINDYLNFEEELELYKIDNYTKTNGEYAINMLNADSFSASYLGEELKENENKLTIYDIITSLKGIKKYEGVFEIINGKLVYIALNSEFKEIAINNNIPYEEPIEPKVDLLLQSNSVIKSDQNAVYLLNSYSKYGLVDMELENKVKIIDLLGNEITNSSEYITFEKIDNIDNKNKQILINVKTDQLLEQDYKIKIDSMIVKDLKGVYNKSETISLNSFEIDNTPPEFPTFNLSTTEITTGNVLVEINFEEDSIENMYKINLEGEWIKYNEIPITISQNGLTVYAKSKDLAGNENISHITISNIATKPNNITNFNIASSSVVRGSVLNVLWQGISSWGSPDNIKNYRLEAQYNNGTWQLIANTSQLSNYNHTVSTNASYTTIKYRVRAENASVYSDWCESNIIYLTRTAINTEMNSANSITITPLSQYVIGDTYKFNYTNANNLSWNVPFTGTIKIESFGPAGANNRRRRW